MEVQQLRASNTALENELHTLRGSASQVAPLKKQLAAAAKAVSAKTSRLSELEVHPSPLRRKPCGATLPSWASPQSPQLLLQVEVAKLSKEHQQTRTKLQRAVRKGKAIERERAALLARLASSPGQYPPPATSPAPGWFPKPVPC